MARKQSEVIAEAQELLRAEIKVITENEDATEDEVARGDTLLEEWKVKDAERQKALAREADVDEVFRASLNAGNREDGAGTARRGPEVMRKVDPYTDESYGELVRSIRSGGTFDEEDTVSRAKAAVEQFSGYVVSDASKDHVMGLLEADGKHGPLIARHILMASSKAYQAEFREYIQSQGQEVGTLMRTAMSLTAGNGGYLVPVQLDPTVVLTNSGAVNPLREISTVKTVAVNQFNGVTSAGVTAEWLTEGSQAADASPTFGQISITAHKAAAYLFGSWEMLSDSGFSSELAGLFADAKNRLEAAAMATANTAADRPRGIVAGVLAVTASIVTAATTGAFVAGDVFNTYDAQRPRSITKGGWLANQKIYSKIRQMSVTGQGSQFWATIGGGQPSELLGVPTFTASSMTGTVGNGTNILLVGDFTYYYIVDRVGFSVQYLPVVVGANQRPTGQAGWIGYWRVGAEVADPDAFRLLQLNQVAAAVALA